MSSQVTVVVEKKSRRRWAAYGFLLIIALMTLGWFIAPLVITWTKSATHGTFPPPTMTKVQIQIAFTLIVFVLLALVSALIVTLFAPRKAINVSEKSLMKERDDEIRYKRKARKRQRTLNREMREYVEKNQK